MLSIVITAYKEERTIREVITCLLDKKYSGIGQHSLDKQWEIILAAPDEGTRLAAEETFKELGIKSGVYKLVVDEQKGKPAALNLCFKEARGEYILLTDGDVVLDKNAVYEIVDLADRNPEFGGITGRPIAAEPKNSMFNYIGALLADAAHHKRTIDLTEHPSGLSTKFVPKRNFFPMSGYLMLIKNASEDDGNDDRTLWQIPEDVLSDDAYISYVLHNQGHKLGYAPAAVVKVKYPTNITDYFKQKKRSTGGYVQLWKYGVVSKDTKTRTLGRELEYFWFPIRYAQNLKELFWSICLYPLRAWLWLIIYWERKVIKKDFNKTWVRIESTK